MSSLLSGPSAITPWIETTMFRSLLEGPQAVTRRPKLVQVLGRGGPGWTVGAGSPVIPALCRECPSYMVVQDGKTSAVAFLGESPSREILHATRGSIVKISDWRVSLSKRCARNHLVHLLQRDDHAATFLSQIPDEESILCFVVQRIDLLGAQGMGIVGNPIDVHRSIEVRRALMSMRNLVTLSEALGLPAEQVRLGDVKQLLEASKKAREQNMPEATDSVACLLSLAHQTLKQNSRHCRIVNGTVLGNVQVLLMGHDTETSSELPLSSILALAAGSTPLVDRAPLLGVVAPSDRDPSAGAVHGDVRERLRDSAASTDVKPISTGAPGATHIDKDSAVGNGGNQHFGQPGQSGAPVLGNVRALLRSVDNGAASVGDVLSLVKHQQINAAGVGKSMRCDDSGVPAVSDDAVIEATPSPIGMTMQSLFSAILQAYNTSTTVATTEPLTRATETAGANSAAKSGVQGLFSSVLQTYRGDRATTTPAPSADEDGAWGLVGHTPTGRAIASSRPPMDDQTAESESDSDIMGISDMLISQTQPDVQELSHQEEYKRQRGSHGDAPPISLHSTEARLDLDYSDSSEKGEYLKDVTMSSAHYGPGIHDAKTASNRSADGSPSLKRRKIGLDEGETLGLGRLRSLIQQSTC